MCKSYRISKERAEFERLGYRARVSLKNVKQRSTDYYNYRNTGCRYRITVIAISPSRQERMAPFHPYTGPEALEAIIRLRVINGNLFGPVSRVPSADFCTKSRPLYRSKERCLVYRSVRLARTWRLKSADRKVCCWKRYSYSTPIYCANRYAMRNDTTDNVVERRISMKM